MVVEPVVPVEPGQTSTTRAAREWYASHRLDVLGRLADQAALAPAEVRSFELLALALDDDPGVVARSRAVRDAWRSSPDDLCDRPTTSPRQIVQEYDRAMRSPESLRSSRPASSVIRLG